MVSSESDFNFPLIESGASPEAVSWQAGALNSRELLQRAIAAQNAGRLREADAMCKALLSREPQNLPATHLRAIIAALRGNVGLAIMLLRKVLRREPTSIGALNQLGALLWMEGKGQEAIELCRKALGLAPNSVEIRDNLGLAYLAVGNDDEAASAFEQAITLKPEFGEGYCHLAVAREAQGRPEDAAAILEQAIARRHVSAQSAARVLRAAGQSLQRLGRFTEAIRCFQRAVELHPQNTAPFLDMAYSKKLSEADRPLINRMQELVADRQLGDGERANLHFALGKAFDDMRVFGDALTHFDEANRLKKPDRKFDRAQHLKTVDWITKTFTRDRCADQPGASHDQTPVIVFGMPRSGTTLVEQILSGHPEIGTGGELLFWGDVASTLSPQYADFTSANASNIAKEYLAILAAVSPNKRLVIDKMPSNFFRIGLIHTIFPRARLIHCRRNPIDTCLSIYFTQFDTGHDYAYDRAEIVFYYEQYLRLMEHWRRVLPPELLFEVDYEKLVEDPEGTSRRLVDFCGLPWNAACLRLGANTSSVKTASVWQVRQPIYTSSLARWRNFEPSLHEFAKLQAMGQESH